MSLQSYNTVDDPAGSSGFDGPERAVLRSAHSGLNGPESVRSRLGNRKTLETGVSRGCTQWLFWLPAGAQIVVYTAVFSRVYSGVHSGCAQCSGYSGVHSVYSGCSQWLCTVYAHSAYTGIPRVYSSVYSGAATVPTTTVYSHGNSSVYSSVATVLYTAYTGPIQQCIQQCSYIAGRRDPGVV